ncbi:YIP1 family protein [bacterium]|nr:YIP1 family protein [bacterium]
MKGLKDIFTLIINPKNLFSNMSEEKPFATSFTLSLTYGLITTLLLIIASIIETDITEGFGFLAIFMAFGAGLIFTAVFLITPFLTGGIIYLICTLCNGEKSYKLSVKSSSFLTIILIPNIMLFFLSPPGPTIRIIFFGSIIYGMWLLYNLIAYTFNIKKITDTQ